MKIDKFIAEVARHSNRTIITNGFPFYGARLETGCRIIPWHFIQTLCGLSSEINYGCDFNGYGLCSSFRRQSESNQISATEKKLFTRCCCAGCSYSTGYLYFMDKVRIADYAKAFKEHDGFWRKGKGCVLPRELRSLTCLRHACVFEWKKQSSRGRVVFSLIFSESSAYIDYLNWLKTHKTLNKDKKSVFEYIDAWDRRIRHRTGKFINLNRMKKWTELKRKS